MKKKVFASVFHKPSNIHLIKDPGMIPYTMQNSFGYASTIVLSDKNEYSYISKYFQDIDITFIKEKNDKLSSLRFLRRTLWIVKNAKKIDVLNLFFFDKWTWTNIWLYMMFNKKGKVYVHCDTDGRRLLEYKAPTNILKKIIQKKILLPEKRLARTLWGVQNEDVVLKLEGKWPFRNVMYVPDGYFWEDEREVVFAEKENIIITVGRIGAKEKRTDILLEGYRLAAEKVSNWKLVLVGPIEDDFKQYIDNFFNKNPNLRGKIEFVGAIEDRNRLQEYYRKAKIFCLCSDWESFGIAQVEAMSQGCALLCTNITASKRIIGEEEYGLLFECGNAEALADKMIDLCSNEQKIRDICVRGQKQAKETYAWSNLLKRVAEWL